MKRESSPIVVRVAPFAVFVVLTALEGRLGEASRYWIYLAKTVVGASMLWTYRNSIREMRWNPSLPGAVVGVVIFALWVGLDGFYPEIGTAPAQAWNPSTFFGHGTFLASLFFLVRLAGTALVVPPLEEVFYRSFFYRYLIAPEFERIGLGTFNPKAFLITAVAFGLVHPQEWLPGILCGIAYQALVVTRGRLGDAIFAHGITNLLLGIWVIWRGAWQFW